MTSNPALGTMKAIIPKILERFQKRFESHLNFHESSRDEAFKGKAKQMFLEEMSKLENSVADQDLEEEVQDHDDFLIFATPSNDHEGSTATAEALRYLENTSTVVEMLHSFPLVKKLFTRTNTPLNSSAAIERVFNFAGILNHPKRASMLPSNFSSCMFIKANESYAVSNAKTLGSA